jgi:hypothetical protein
MSPPLDDLDPVPHGLVEQARRYAEHAAALMRSGAFDHQTLAELWGVSVPATRKRVQRLEGRHELFTVTYLHRVFVPAVVLDPHGAPRPGLRELIAVLAKAGDGGFALWAWLVSPSPYLSGEIPAEVAMTAPDRAERAARARAAEL